MSTQKSARFGVVGAGLWGWRFCDVSLCYTPAAGHERLVTEVALMQGNIPQDQKFVPGTGVTDSLRWYGEQLRDVRTPLVVAPETALPLLPRRRGTLDFRAVPLPALDPHEKQDVTSFRQAGVRQFLKNDRAPVAQRLRAVVALGNAPSAVSNPMLRELLNDATEDLRLLAYGMLDTREKKINAAIHAERGQYAAAENAAERLLAARRLAGLYWELIYQGLVQGDLMEHAAHEGFKYMSEVMAAEPTNAGVALQFGRLLHQMGRHEEAEAAYRGARVLGLPAPRVEPYRAELAFLRRDFDEVREIIEHLDNWQGLSRLQPVVRLWSRQARDTQASTAP